MTITIQKRRNWGKTPFFILIDGIIVCESLDFTTVQFVKITLDKLFKDNLV